MRASFAGAVILGAVLCLSPHVGAQTADQAPQPGSPGSAPADAAAGPPAQPAAPAQPSTQSQSQGQAATAAAEPAKPEQPAIGLPPVTAPGPSPTATPGVGATGAAPATSVAGPPPQLPGQPANLCWELVGYLTPKPPAAPAAGAPAPAAPAAPPPVKPSMTLDQAQALARDNNLAACQGAAKDMRRAGVPLPAALLALAALNPELLAGRPAR